MRRFAVVTAALAVALTVPAEAHAADPPSTFGADTWLSAVAVGPQPKGVASLPGLALVANSGAGSVSTVVTCQPKSCAPSASVASATVGAGPTSIAVTAASTPNAYVSNADANTVTLLSGLQGQPATPLATIPVGVRPAGLAATASRVFVANNGSNSVSVIDQASNSAVATIPVGSSPWGVATDGTTVYVANSGDGTVSVIDAATLAVTGVIPVGTAPAGVALGGTTLYVTNSGSASVSVIDTATRAVTATLPVGAQPWGIAVVGGSLFVANYGAASVAVFRTTTLQQTATLTTAGTPFGVAGTDGGQLEITDTAANLLYTVPLRAQTPAPTWSSNRHRRSVTGVVQVSGMIQSMAGVTYGIVAKSGSRTRTGTCRTVGGNVRCTVSNLPRGRVWRVSVTTQFPWQDTPGGQQNRRFRF